MRLLALIPARGGSKRVPRKNVRLLGEKPLIAWSIDFARELEQVGAVVVSTDDVEIAAIATAAGAMLDGLRPAHLASDTASSLDVALYELDRYEAAHGPVDGLLLLQPTSPFRRRSTVLEAIALFASSGHAVVGMVPAATHPAWSFSIENGRIVRFIDSAMPVRSQDLPPAYQISGGVYLISPAQLRAELTFFPADAAAIVSTNEAEAIDIDTEWDWLCAEQAIKADMVEAS